MQIRQSLAASQAMGAMEDRPYHLALLAEASPHVGQTAAGLEALTEALATLAKNMTRWWEAELYRLRGELLLQQTVVQLEEAEVCFQHALAVARGQQAKSLELRTAMSLARLWQRQDKQVEAHELLAPIYGWFTEGFDTADLTSRRPRQCWRSWEHKAQGLCPGCRSGRKPLRSRTFSSRDAMQDRSE